MRVFRLVFISVVMILPLAVAGCNRKKEQDKNQFAQPVKVITLKPTSVVVEKQLPGRVSAFEIAQVRPQVNGVIKRRLFTQGQDVKAGEQLYLIDPASYKAAYDAAAATLAQMQANNIAAQAKFQRYKSLIVAHAISQQDYDDASAAAKQAAAQVSQARADLERTKIDLNYTRVMAPISGRIGRSMATVGALAVANQPDPLSVITRLDPVYVDVNMASTDLLRLQHDMRQGKLVADNDSNSGVTLSLEDGSKYPIKGKVEFTEAIVDENTGTVFVRILFPNPDHILLPGMLVRAEIAEGVRRDAILVPQNVLTRDVKGNGVVNVVENNKVVPKTVKADQAIGTNWIIDNGLQAGERVIVVGGQKTRAGMLVNPVEIDQSSETDKLQEKQNRSR